MSYRQHRYRFALPGACALVLAGSLLAPNAAQAVICANAGAGTSSGNDTADPGSTACGAGSLASGDGSSAYGLFAEASGNVSGAFGNSATASGVFSLAFGNFAKAAGPSSVAIGSKTQALGDGSIAIGNGAVAAPDNSAAFGAGATAVRPNQQVFGTAANTYTMPGITSAQSKAVQGAPTHIVTTNPSGDLAAHTPAELGLAGSTDVFILQKNVEVVQKQINVLIQNDRELMDGIAVSLALAQPIFQPGQTFAVRVGWGNFQDSNALGLTAAGVLTKGYWGPTSAVVLDGGIGVGVSEGVVGARAGLTFGW